MSIGGVGKTTLLRDLEEENSDRADFIHFSFELSLYTETPLDLMKALHESVEKKTKPHFLLSEILPKPDSFASLYEQYQQTLQKLETQPIEGQESVSSEQIKTVENLGKFGWELAEKVVPMMPALDTTVNIAKGILSVRDLVKQHQATRSDPQLQKLMIKPLETLTKAFAEVLINKSKKHPLIFIIDGYEKVPKEIDTWLWCYLIANTDLKNSTEHNIKFVIAGRFSLLKTEGWRRLKQDYQTIYMRNLDKFDRSQTQLYLTKCNIPSCDRDNIYTSTKGLPYYLNWIREQQEQGIKWDFSVGSNEIASVLLHGLKNPQKRLIQMVACCHWFNEPLIQSLIKHQGNYLNGCVPDLDWFKWLINQNFVMVVKHRYCLDDVARDLFRRTLWQDNPDLLRQTHTFLADYFEEKASPIVSSDSSLDHRLKNPDWCRHTAESWYHRFFSQPNECQRKFLSNLSTNNVLKESKLMSNTVTAIFTEEAIGDEEYSLLTHDAREFLKTR